MRRTMIVASVLLVGLASAAWAQEAPSDAWFGTWELNLAKSKYSPGPPPMSETRTYERFKTDGVKATFHRVDAAGKKLTITFSAMYDGKDYPYMGIPDGPDTIALKQVDAHTLEATLKSKGKVVQTSRTVLSPDGKTRTSTLTGTNATGQKIDNVVVFEKQS
jgi:hypothetical protein